MEKLPIEIIVTSKEMVPVYSSDMASGADLKADLSVPVTITPGHTVVVPTGVTLHIPAGYEGQVRPRSGLAAGYGITILNTPGTIDADYRGEVKILLTNHGSADFIVKRGDRIAQIIFSPVMQASFKMVSQLGSTDRGAGGFGSTGI